MKVHAQPCATGPAAWTHQYDLLRQLHAASTPRLHEWAEDPAEADVIFLTNIEQPAGPALETHALPHRYPEKCFVLSEQWEPPFLLAGIYANVPRSFGWRGRFRTGSYALHHPDFRNPFIKSYPYVPAGERPHPDLLASFLGRNCHPLRARLLAMNFSPDRILVEDASDFNAFTHSGDKLARQRRYFDLCLRSKFMLCPRGAGPNSIRLFEALKLGIAPVIMADAWVPCAGPRWHDFALFIREREIGQLPAILEHAAAEYTQRGALARAAYQEFFSTTTYFNYLVAAAVSARTARIIPERWFVALWPAQRWWRRCRQRGRRLIARRLTS